MLEMFRMKAAAGGGLELQKFEDLIVPKVGVDPREGVERASKFEYREGDIIQCTYPKSGTHWFGNMLWKLKTLDTSRRPIDTVLELGPSEVFETMESPRIIMTHYKPNRLPPEHLKNRGKIILILRNPKDVMVSMYHHWKDAVLFQSNQTWDEFFESFISGLTVCGSFFDHIKEWEQFLKDKPTDQHVEIFYYEDFKANPKTNIARLNHFLGFNRDQKHVDKVLEETTLSALKKQDAAGKRETIAMVHDVNGDSVIYRKGEVGGWKNYLTVAQSETIDRLLKESLKYGIISFK